MYIRWHMKSFSYAALWGAFRGRSPDIAHHGTRFEAAVDQFEYPFIRDSSLHQRHQFVVVDPVKEFFQVHVHGPSIPLVDVTLGLMDGLMGRAPRSEAVSYTHLRAHETDSYLVCRLL